MSASLVLLYACVTIYTLNIDSNDLRIDRRADRSLAHVGPMIICNWVKYITLSVWKLELYAKNFHDFVCFIYDRENI